MKRKVLGCLLILFMLSKMNMGVCAETMDDTGELNSLSSYNTETFENKTNQVEEIVDFFVTANEIEIDNSGESKWVDVKGILADGLVIDLTQKAKWTSKNLNIVYADQGRLLALAAGETEVEVLYGEYSIVINVTVMNNQDIAGIIDELNENQVMSRAAVSSTEKGKQMVEYIWTPTQDVRGWRNQKTFCANVSYVGIPYSQTAYQVDKDGFIAAMNNTSFYDSYTRTLNGETIIMPKYGNDCSGFVSFCWGISRQTTASFISGIKNGTYTKVGTYDADNPTTTSLMTSYRNLAPGNAVVKAGHTFLIASNDRTNKKVYVYEQTHIMRGILRGHIRI